MGQSTSKVSFPSIDFKAEVIETDKSVYEANQELLSKQEKYVKEISEYSPKDKEIRAAISKPSKETQEACWNAILPQVEMVNGFYEYALQIQEVFKKSVDLIMLNASDSLTLITAHQSVVCQLLDFIAFSLSFDQKKLACPGLQNDFSYYRRVVSRMKSVHPEDIKIGDEVTNRMSLFFAYSSPMLLNISNTLATIMKNDEVKSGLTLSMLEILGMTMSEMANVCRNNNNEQEGLKYLKIMIGIIIMYDKLSPKGVFKPTKGSELNIVQMLRVLKTYDQNNGEVVALMNCLRYETIHLNDEDTPKNIKLLLVQ